MALSSVCCDAWWLDCSCVGVRKHTPTTEQPLIVVVIDALADLTKYVKDRKLKERFEVPRRRSSSAVHRHPGLEPEEHGAVHLVQPVRIGSTR